MDFCHDVLEKLDRETSVDVVCVQCFGGNYADELRRICFRPFDVRITALSYGPVPFQLGQGGTIGDQLNIPGLEEWVKKHMNYKK